jgi:hypothetical protein
VTLWPNGLYGSRRYRHRLLQRALSTALVLVDVVCTVSKNSATDEELAKEPLGGDRAGDRCAGVSDNRPGKNATGLPRVVMDEPSDDVLSWRFLVTIPYIGGVGGIDSETESGVSGSWPGTLRKCPRDADSMSSPSAVVGRVEELREDAPANVTLIAGY